MPCNHRHLVIHRNDAEDHQMGDSELEASCSCGPGLLCPVCDWQQFYHECFVVAPPELVDAHLATPPQNQMN